MNHCWLFLVFPIFLLIAYAFFDCLFHYFSKSWSCVVYNILFPTFMVKEHCFYPFAIFWVSTFFSEILKDNC